eukprot:2245057-Prymnesium_polylepis.1
MTWRILQVTWRAGTRAARPHSVTAARGPPSFARARSGHACGGRPCLSTGAPRESRSSCARRPPRRRPLTCPSSAARSPARSSRQPRARHTHAAPRNCSRAPCATPPTHARRNAPRTSPAAMAATALWRHHSDSTIVTAP